MFDLSRDKYLLDYNYFSNRVDQDIIIDRRTLSKNIAIDEFGLPKLFFEVVINQSGKIIKVNYNSWGKKVYKNLINDVKKELLTKSVKPYKFIGYPVKVKLDIGVLVK